jgi:hypothetical protein
VVAQVFTSIIRFASDSIGSITESVDRLITINRLAADAVSAITEVVTRVGTFTRSLADSVPTITEIVSGIIKTVHAITATISIATMSAVLAIRRMVASVSISSLSAAVTVNGEAMTDILVEADTAPLIQATLTDSVTGAAPTGLASATVFFQLRLISDRRYRINAECDILDAAAGLVSYELQPEDLDFDGECQAQFLVVFADQTRQTTAVPIPVTVRSR